MSKIETNTIAPSTGTTLTLGESGDTVTLGSGAIQSGFGGTNTPAFFAHSASDQTGLADNTYSKVTLGTEVFDTASAFASSRFTVPSGEAGKYFFYGSARCHVGGNSDLNKSYTAFYLNGSRYLEAQNDFQANPIRSSTVSVHVVIDLSVGDYVELYAAVDHAGSYGISLQSADKATSFGGYKIIE